VAVAADRIAGLGLLVGQGCDFAIMDDGFQSVRLHFDFALIVIDAQRGIGNGHVVPGGPLRAPVSTQLRLADAVLRIGDGNGAVPVVRGAARAGKPVYGAETRIVGRKRYAGRRFLAFAGIGHPEKFFAALRDAGAETVLTREFGDHHPYSDDDIRSLAAEAEKAGLELATTAKDAVRFENGTPTAREFLKRLAVVEIETVFSPARVAGKIIDETVANFRRRTIG
jgi:tetraacyldisaccharide 4'-kinase